MGKKETRVRIDIRTAETAGGKNSDSSSHLGQVQYVALNDMGVVWLDKIYGNATPQNSIDFLKRVVAQAPIPIDSICTDNGLAFDGEFSNYLEVRGIWHERDLPYVPRRM